jgi:hypothetical protein
MAKEGPWGTSVPPILIRDQFGTSSAGDTPQRNPGAYQLGNGGHRVAIAHELGWKAMRTTDSKVQSGYGDTRFNGNNGGDENSDVDSHANVLGSEHSSDQPWSEFTSSGANGYGIPANSGYTAVRKAAKERGSLDPAMTWGHGGNANVGRTHGLHTDLHGPDPHIANLSAQQFNGVPAPEGQGKLPGMPPHFVGGGPTEGVPGYDTSAPHGRWPGGGKVLTGDL